MSEQDYASKDLKRRPFRTTLILVSLTSVVAATTFLFLFANVLLDVTTIVTSGETTSSLRVFFETFIWAILLLVVILGAVVFWSTISLEIVTRRKDIGLMKAIGTLMDTIFDHFMAQAVILILASIIIGLGVGIVLYLAGMFWLASVVSGLEFTFNFPWIQLIFLSFIYLIVGYFGAQKPIYDTVQETAGAALNPEIGLKVRRSGYLDTFGLPFRIATKATGRRIKGSRRALLSLFLSISLASMLWIGGGVVEATTDAYIIRSMGSNVVAVGHPDLLARYYGSYSLTGSKLNDSFTFLEQSHMIPSDLVLSLQQLPSVIQVESRLVDYTSVEENAAVILNPTTGEYERIGRDRVSSSLIVGINWDETVSDWYYEGLEANTSQDAWIGGVMASSLFEDPLVQSLGVQGSSLQIKAIAFDLLNGGDVAFMELSTMQELWGVSGVNLVLVQLESYTPSIISQIENAVNPHGLAIILQQEVLEQNLQTVGAFWALLQPLSIIALFSAFLSLMNYLLVSVFSRLRDYIIMRSIGAKPSFLAKTIIAEGLDMGLKSGIPGVALAVIFSVYFLVPEAAVPSIFYLPLVIGATLLSLVLVVVLASIPVYLVFNSKSDLRVTEFSV